MPITKTVNPFRRLSLVFALAAASFLGAHNAQAQAPRLEYPQTAYSGRTQKIVKEFNAASSAPLIILDRDLLALNLALRHISDFDPEARSRLIAEMAKAQTGLTIDATRFREASYEMTREVGSTWSPGYGPSADMPGAGFCTVFGQDPDTDGPKQLLSLMNLSDFFGPSTASRLTAPLSRAVINDYTDYHELGHCFYYVTPPNAGAERDSVLFQRHKQEAFSDIFASLLLARDGVTDFADRYARVRLVASAVAGIDDEYLHATWDGLEAVQREIDARGVEGMKKMPVNDIRDLALRLAEENTLDLKTVRLAAKFQHSQYDEAALENELKKDPALLEAADYARRMKSRMSDALVRDVDLKGLGPGNLSPLQLVNYYMNHDEESAEEPAVMPYDQLTVKLRDELVLAAKTPNGPTVQSLTLALAARKDALRETLDDSDAQKRRIATRALFAIDKAFQQALGVIEGPKAPKPAV
jgi:hypothetical protein